MVSSDTAMLPIHLQHRPKSHLFQTQQSLSQSKCLFITQSKLPPASSSCNIFSVMLSLLEYHDFCFEANQTTIYFTVEIDVSSPTPPSTLTIQNISLRNNTWLPSGKLACLPVSEIFLTMLPPFCLVVDPATHLSIITSLAGCKLAHPPFWLQPQSTH